MPGGWKVTLHGLVTEWMHERNAEQRMKNVFSCSDWLSGCRTNSRWDPHSIYHTHSPNRRFITVSNPEIIYVASTHDTSWCEPLCRIFLCHFAFLPHSFAYFFICSTPIEWWRRHRFTFHTRMSFIFGSFFSVASQSTSGHSLTPHIHGKYISEFRFRVWFVLTVSLLFSSLFSSRAIGVVCDLWKSDTWICHTSIFDTISNGSELICVVANDLMARHVTCPDTGRCRERGRENERKKKKLRIRIIMAHDSMNRNETTQIN